MNGVRFRRVIPVMLQKINMQLIAKQVLNLPVKMETGKQLLISALTVDGQLNATGLCFRSLFVVQKKKRVLMSSEKFVPLVWKVTSARAIRANKKMQKLLIALQVKSLFVKMENGMFLLNKNPRLR